MKLKTSTLSDKIKSAKGNAKLDLPVLSPTTVKEKEFTFRVLPYKHQLENDPSILVYMHNNIGPTGKNYAMCPEQMFGEPCPYCEMVRKIYESANAEGITEDNKKGLLDRARQIKAKVTVYLPGIVRGSKPSFQFLKLSKATNYDKEFLAIIQNKNIITKLYKKDPETVDFVAIWDLKEGVDMVVTKNEPNSSCKYPTFSLASDIVLSPAGSTPAEREIIKEYWANTPNLAERMVEVNGCAEKINELYEAQFKNVGKQEPKTQSVTTGNTSIKETAIKETAIKDTALPENTTKEATSELDDILNIGEEEEPTTTTKSNDIVDSSEDDFNSFLNSIE